MDTDLIFVAGVIVAAVSLPSILTSFIDQRSPRAGAIGVLVGGGFIVFASMNKVGGYALNDVPALVVQVIGNFF